MPARDIIIGDSAEGRPICVKRLGADNAGGRIFLLAGQHGDEPLAREALQEFIESRVGRFTNDGSIQCAALLDANPDGSSRRQRKSAQGIDLNRDHQLLSAPETQAIHSFVRRWRPQLVIDVHTYPPRRKHLLARNLAHCHDVYLDVANNPCATCEAGWADTLSEMLPRWVANVRQDGFRAARYVVITKCGRVRHSTPDCVDARNGLALRYGIPTVLLEGREPTRFDAPSAATRTCRGLVAAIETVCSSFPSIRSSAVARHQTPLPHRLPIRARYVKDPRGLAVEFRDTATGTLREFTLSEDYAPTVEPVRHVQLPSAYAVPTSQRALLELLEQHGFGQLDEPTDVGPLTEIGIRLCQPSSHPRRAPRRIEIETRRCQQPTGEFVLVPVTGGSGRALAVFLEPESKHGLLRYPSLGLRAVAGEVYPVRRVIKTETARVDNNCAAR